MFKIPFKATVTENTWPVFIQIQNRIMRVGKTHTAAPMPAHSS